MRFGAGGLRFGVEGRVHEVERVLHRETNRHILRTSCIEARGEAVRQADQTYFEEVGVLHEVVGDVQPVRIGLPFNDETTGDTVKVCSTEVAELVVEVVSLGTRLPIGRGEQREVFPAEVQRQAAEGIG